MGEVRFLLGDPARRCGSRYRARYQRRLCSSGRARPKVVKGAYPCQLREWWCSLVRPSAHLSTRPVFMS